MTFRARTQLSLTKTITLTAPGAETQTLGTDYASEFEAAWPAESRDSTAVGYLKNTSGAACVIYAQAASDAATTGPLSCSEPGAATGTQDLRLGPYLRSVWLTLQFRFTDSGQADLAFDLVAEEG